jgi:hypothetical protein
MLLLKDDRGRRSDTKPREDWRPATGGPRIRCPRCAWEPERSDTWMCSCLHVWNTFETLGVCPGCGREWEETQCRRCHEWSRHADWYAKEP